MKKNDVIHKRKEIKGGEALMHDFSTLDRAGVAMRNIGDFYNLPGSAMFECKQNAKGLFSVYVKDDTFVTLEARINWRVDREIGVTYLDSGGSGVIDLDDEAEKGWVVVESSAPVYQSGVENMSDEELRASIEALRGARVSKPVKVKAASKVKAPKMTAQEKKLEEALKGMGEEERLDLQRKLGLIE